MAVNGKAYAPAQEFKYLYAKFHRNRCSTSYIVQAVKADYQSYFRIIILVGIISITLVLKTYC